MHTLKLERGDSILLDLVTAHTTEDQGTFWDDGNTPNLACGADDSRAHICQNLEEVPFLVHKRFSVKVISNGLRPSLPAVPMALWDGAHGGTMGRGMRDR